jgi:hypothetical protein
MEVISSSETSVETQRTTRHHIPEDGTPHMKLFIVYTEFMKVLQCSVMYWPNFRRVFYRSFGAKMSNKLYVDLTILSS